MIAALRDVCTGELTGVHRTRLDADGRKVDRRMLGQAGGSAVMLDGFEAISAGLTLAEGVETGLAARQLGLSPVWAVGSVSGIASFPLLGGIESLTLCAETDATGANAAAIRECGNRWHRASRAVDIAVPDVAGDLNDEVMRGRTAA